MRRAPETEQHALILTLATAIQDAEATLPWSQTLTRNLVRHG